MAPGTVVLVLLAVDPVIASAGSASSSSQNCLGQWKLELLRAIISLEARDSDRSR